MFAGYGPIKTISDILSCLTEDEKRLHEEIIEECLEREALLNSNREVIIKNTQKLGILAEKIVDDIENFNQIFTALSELEKELKQKHDRLKLLSIPEEKFFHG